MASVFAIVVTYNGLQWIDRCLGSLEASDTPVSTIVVDNASTDGTAEYIASNYPKAQLIRSKTNYGFSKSNNIGIRQAYDQGADYIFLLNQDAYIEKHTLSSLCSVAASNEKIGVVSPIHMNGDGSAMDWGFTGYMPSEFISDLYMGHLAKTYVCRFINAAAWLMKRSCIETVGGFDTSMFVHYGEDTNYSHRMQFHQLEIVLDTEAIIYHDREFRKDHEKEYRSKVFNQPNLRRNLDFADIRNATDIDSMIKSNRTSIIKSYVKLHFGKAKKLKEYEQFLLKAKNSRETNMKKGLSWL